MRREILLLLMLAGCSVSQQHGELSVQPPPVFQDQSWKIVRQDAKAGERVCAVNAGEVDVLQVARGAGVRDYVIIDRRLRAGTEYKLLVGGNVYRMSGGGYDARESAAIVQDLLSDEVLYTEWSEIFAARPGANWIRIPNKIRLAGFAAAYEECRRFVMRSGK